MAEGLAAREHFERLLPQGGRARRVLGWGIIAWSGTGAVVILAVVFRVFARVASIFPYLVVASMVVFVLNPAVRRLAGMGLPRRLAAAIVFVGAAVLTAVLLSLAVPVLIHQAQVLGRSSGGLVRKGGGLFDGLTRSSSPMLRDAGRAIKGWLESHAGNAPKALGTLATAGLQLAHAGVVLVLGGFL